MATKEWDQNREEEAQWVAGDGGPLIILQAGAVPQWQGASNFEQSLMNGGSVETDYDVICNAGDEPAVLKRYDRDMVVMSDSEWAGGIFTKGDMVVVVQYFYYDEGALPDIVERALSTPPRKSVTLEIVDSTLRLLVGADDGAGTQYGFAEVDITIGPKQCEAWTFDDGIVVVFRPIDRSVPQA